MTHGHLDTQGERETQPQGRMYLYVCNKFLYACECMYACMQACIYVCMYFLPTGSEERGV